MRGQGFPAIVTRTTLEVERGVFIDGRPIDRFDLLLAGGTVGDVVVTSPHSPELGLYERWVMALADRDGQLPEAPRVLQLRRVTNLLTLPSNARLARRHQAFCDS